MRRKFTTRFGLTVPFAAGMVVCSWHLQQTTSHLMYSAFAVSTFSRAKCVG